MTQPTTAPRPSVWQLDTRSLGLFRVGLGATLAAMAIQKAWFARAFFSDEGILLHESRQAGMHSSVSWLFAISGDTSFVYAITASLMISGVLLMVGRLVRPALCVSWLVLCSLNHRNPLIGQIADHLIVLWLIWAMFMPLDRAFAWRRPSTEPHSVRGAIGVVWPLQLFAIYLIAGVFKLYSPGWTEGTLMIEAMHIAPVATPIGRALIPATGLLTVLTYLTLPLELVGWLGALSPWKNGPIRTGTVLVFMGFHLFGIGLLMHLGLVAVVLAIGWLPLLPPWFWDEALPRLLRRPPGRELQQVRSVPRWQSGLLTAAFVVSWMTWPGILQGKLLPTEVAVALRQAHLSQNQYSLWTRPAGSRNDIVAARLADGTHWDLFADQPLDWHNPRHRPFDNQWYKLLQQLRMQHGVTRGLASWFTREWNAHHPEDRWVESVQVAVLQAPVRPPRWWKQRAGPEVVPKQKVHRWGMTASYDDDGRLKLSPLSILKGDPRQE